MLREIRKTTSIDRRELSLERGGDLMKFYSVQLRENVEVPDDKIEYVTLKNRKKAAKASIVKNGKTIKLFRIVKNKK